MTVLYDYSQHRDTAVRSLLLHFLSQVSGCGQYRLGVGVVNWHCKMLVEGDCLEGNCHKVCPHWYINVHLIQFVCALLVPTLLVDPRK